VAYTDFGYAQGFSDKPTYSPHAPESLISEGYRTLLGVVEYIKPPRESLVYVGDQHENAGED
jgi:hypothetical protein